MSDEKKLAGPLTAGEYMREVAQLKDKVEFLQAYIDAEEHYQHYLEKIDSKMQEGRKSVKFRMRDAMQARAISARLKGDEFTVEFQEEYGDNEVKLLMVVSW